MASLAEPRLVALTGVVAFALLAAGSGLDRASASNPDLARLVPGMIAADAYRAVAAQALTTGKTEAAKAAARQAVRTDPIDPRSTAVLGAAYLAAREPARADQAFRVAARFGWRDPLTQLYFMNAGLTAGQPRLAALRLDAVLRQAPNFPVRDMLLAQFERTESGRAALAERLALRPAWTAAFLGDRSALPLATLQTRAGIVAGLPAPKWGCDAVAPLVTRLILQGGPVAARRLWLAQCPAAVPGIADRHFTAKVVGRAPTAFEWNLVGSGDTSAAPAAPAGSGLLVRLSGPASQPVAWQMLVLAPGRYRLTWTAATPVGEPSSAAVLSLSCRMDDRRPVEARPIGPNGQFEAVVRIDGSCEGHYLTLWLSPGPVETRFDSPTIAPLSD